MHACTVLYLVSTELIYKKIKDDEIHVKTSAFANWSALVSLYSSFIILLEWNIHSGCLHFADSSVKTTETFIAREGSATAPIKWAAGTTAMRRAEAGLPPCYFGTPCKRASPAAYINNKYTVCTKIFFHRSWRLTSVSNTESGRTLGCLQEIQLARSL